MSKDNSTKTLDWDLPKIANKAEHEKLIRSYHEREKTQNKDRLLYPPEEIGPASQFHYTKERRN